MSAIDLQCETRFTPPATGSVAPDQVLATRLATRSRARPGRRQPLG